MRSVTASLLILLGLVYTAGAQDKETPEHSFATAPDSKPAPGFIPAEARSYAAQAEKAFSAGQLDEAESFYKKALTFSPDNPSLLVSLAAIETRKGNLADSEKFLQQALPHNLRNAPAWLLLGMNYLQQKRDEEAFAALVQATLYDDRNPRAHNYLGIASGRKGWEDASEQELRRAVELDPNYADANFNLAVLYLRRTPPLIELARRHYQEALDLGAQKDPLIEAQLTNAVASPESAPATSSSSPSTAP